jgi:hypothetical protein
MLRLLNGADALLEQALALQLQPSVTRLQDLHSHSVA